MYGTTQRFSSYRTELRFKRHRERPVRIWRAVRAQKLGRPKTAGFDTSPGVGSISRAGREKFMRELSLVILAAACCVATTQTAVAASQPQPMYRVTILSDAGAAGRSINDLGLVGGSYTLVNKSVHAGVWAFGKQTDLGTLGSGAGLSSRVLWPVKNNLGLISGISLTDKLDPNQEGWSCGFFLNNPNFNTCLGF